MLVDLSGSICGNSQAQGTNTLSTCENLRLIRSFTQAVVRDLFETDTGTEIAVILFSSQASLAEPFTTDIDDIDTALSGITSDGSTRTDQALQLAISVLAEQDGRPGRAVSTNVIILITDGKPTEGFEQVNQNAYMT